MLNRILDLLYPPKCPFCGEILKENGICEKCRLEITKISEPRCMKCGKPIQKEEEEYCFDCKKRKHEFEDGVSLWVHRPPVSDALYRFKYNGLRCYGKVFAREAADSFYDYLERREVEAFVPIPLSKKRYRNRGYNQAEILAVELSDLTGIPVKNLLKRVKETNPQKQLNDKARKRNIQNAFAVNGPVFEKSVVLVDDIFTTGSTLDEAAKILKREGVSKVYFLTISIGQGF